MKTVGLILVLLSVAIYETKTEDAKKAHDHNICGVRHFDGLAVRTDSLSEYADYGEIPWMIALLFDGSVKCGGSLIHPQVILTAAHCVSRRTWKKDLIARAGEWDIESKDELYQTQDREISKIVIHPDYVTPKNRKNDIALLFIAEQFNLTDHISTVCLPPTNMNFDYNKCFANGWGRINGAEDFKPSSTLKKIELEILPSNICKKNYQEAMVGKDFQVHESYICASSNNKTDTCAGDGGGPLNCPIPEHKGRYYQVGIVSFGAQCDGSLPSWYSSTGYFRNWIDNEISKNAIQNYYTII